MTNIQELKQKYFFDSKAEHYETDSDDSWVLLDGINSFLNFVDPKLPQNILELGCGYGRWTMHLLRRGHRVSAVDISKNSLLALKEQAEKEQLFQGLTLINSNFEEDLFEESFDGAILAGVIHHLNYEKRRLIFSNVVKSVRPGGWVASFDPNPYNPLFYPLYLVKGLWEIERGFLSCNLPRITKLYRDNGLTSIQVDRYGLLPSRWAKICRFVVPLNRALNKIPLINKLAVFNYIKGIKV